MVSVFHLNNMEASRRVNVIVDGSLLPYSEVIRYLGVDFDRSLTFKHHLVKHSGKIKTRGNLLWKLAGSTWGADAKTLRTAALGLVYSFAEYCCSTWFNSKHVKLIDVQLNNVMRTITGCISSTPLPWLHTLSNIAPPHFRRMGITSKLIRKSLAIDCSLLSRFLKDVPLKD